MVGDTRPFLRDLVGELETAMKTDSREQLREAALPLLQICVDSVTSEVPSFDQGFDQLIGTAVGRLDSPPERKAVKQLFLGEGRWRPLAVRGPAAASELGVTYDGLRRRNKEGVRRLDLLLTKIAQAIIDITALDEIGIGRLVPVKVPDPGKNVFERASVFLSYSRHDDEHEGGLVSALRESLVSEFKFQTGQDLFVFHDKSSIELGENWRRKLEEGIDETSFLLVILTPSYLRSPHCREELERFLRRESEERRDDLVLPIYYATISPDTSDSLAKALLDHQYVDWRSLRFQPFDSAPVRMAVAELVSSIASAVARSSDVPRVPIRDQSLDELGLLERMSEMELALPRFVRGLVALTGEQEGVTEEVREETIKVERLNRMGRGSAARLVAAKRLSSKLEPYAERMEEIAQAMRGDLDTVEHGIRAMAEALPTASEEGVEDAVETMIGAIHEALSATDQAANAVQTMSEVYSETARIASTMRPVVNRLIPAVKVVADCPARFRDWIQILQAALDVRRAS